MSSQHLPSYFFGKLFSSHNVVLGDCQPDCTILLVKVITLKMGSWSTGTWKDAQQQLIIRENVNQNHNEISLHTWQNSYKKKTHNKCWWGCRKKENSAALLSGMQIGVVIVEIVWRVLQKLKKNHMIQQFHFIWRKSKH